MIGRFLELSVHATDIIESIGFYENLGFRQAAVGDVWSHHYAVLGDGAIAIGLHRYEFDSPSITFVRPGLAAELTDLKARGVELAFAKTGEDEFHEAGFREEDGHMVTILEARTFSPLGVDDDQDSLCGRFAEISLPVRDVETSAALWRRLGMETIEDGPSEPPYPRARLAGGDITIGLHETRELRRVSLSFRCADLEDALERLLSAGVSPRMGLAPAGVAALEAPDGVPLLLWPGADGP